MTRTKSKAAAALMVEAERAEAAMDELMAELGACFGRVEPRLQAWKYVRAICSDLPKRNG